jgi:hypothetical protein
VSEDPADWELNPGRPKGYKKGGKRKCHASKSFSEGWRLFSAWESLRKKLIEP